MVMSQGHYGNIKMKTNSATPKLSRTWIFSTISAKMKVRSLEILSSNQPEYINIYNIIIEAADACSIFQCRNLHNTRVVKV